MTNTDILPDESSNLAALRQALAITRLIAYQETLEKKSAYDTDTLLALFETIHNEAYSDWRQRPTALHPPGSTQKKAELKNIIQGLFPPREDKKSLSDEKNDKKPLFDGNQYVIRYPSDDIALLLADFYAKIRALKPFDYGNELTLDFFIQALGNTPAFRAKYPEIDLRRMDEADVKNLHDPHASRSKLAAAFKHAIATNRTPYPEEEKQEYPTWQMKDVEIGSLKLLSYNHPQYHECLVRVDGGLVPLKKIMEDTAKWIPPKTQLADFPPIPNEDIVGYLPGTEKLRLLAKGEAGYVEGEDKCKDHIDGFKISHDRAPLFCLSADILTGLTKSRHDAFVNALKKVSEKGEKASVHELNESDTGEDARKLKARLLEAEKDDPALRRSIEIAYDHINRITKKLDEKKLTKFEGKTSLKDTNKKPKIFMALGGAGSGKSSAEQAAQVHCGQNFAVASLDEFRKDSDLYKVLIAAGHHGDDYNAVEPFANALRTWVANYAKENKFNLVYDGSGIEFVPRYRNIIRDFKKHGYETEVIGAERAIHSAIAAIIDRSRQKEGRTLPWRTVIEKHSQMPESFMAAVEEPAVDKITLFALDSRDDYKKDYLMAESFVLKDKDLEELKERQKQGRLSSRFKDFMKDRSDSFLKQIAGKKIANKKGEPETIPDIDTLINRIPDFSDANVTYLAYHTEENTNRVLAIYDIKRFVKMMQKSSLNTEASGQDGIESLPKTMKFLPHGSWRAAVDIADQQQQPSTQRS